MQNKLLALALATLPITASAQSSDVEIPRAVKGSVEGLLATGEVAKVTYVDLDADGTLEALVQLKSGPIETAPEMREWQVIDEVDGLGRPVGIWYGEDVRVHPVPEDTVINPEMPMSASISSDGSYWFLFKGRMRAYGSLSFEKRNMVTEGSAEDAVYLEEFGITENSAQNIVKMTVDATDAVADDTLMFMRGDGYWRADDGVVPYALVTASGEVLKTGWSFAYPDIYKMPGGGFQIIEQFDGGYQGYFFPEVSQ